MRALGCIKVKREKKEKELSALRIKKQTGSLGRRLERGKLGLCWRNEQLYWFSELASFTGLHMTVCLMDAKRFCVWCTCKQEARLEDKGQYFCGQTQHGERWFESTNWKQAGGGGEQRRRDKRLET